MSLGSQGLPCGHRKAIISLFILQALPHLTWLACNRAGVTNQAGSHQLQGPGRSANTTSILPPPLRQAATMSFIGRRMSMAHSQPARKQSRWPLPSSTPAGCPGLTGRPALSWRGAAEPVISSCKQPQPQSAPHAIHHHLASQQHGPPQKQAHDILEQASPAGRQVTVAGLAYAAQAAFPWQDAQPMLEPSCPVEEVDQKALQADKLRCCRIMRAVLAHLQQRAAIRKAELKEEKELMEWGEPPIGPHITWISAEGNSLALQAANAWCKDELPSSHDEPRGHIAASTSATTQLTLLHSRTTPTPARPSRSLNTAGTPPASF